MSFYVIIYYIIFKDSMKIMVGTPSVGNSLSTEYYFSIRNLEAKLTELGHEFEVITIKGDSLVTRARNKLVNLFLKRDFDYLLFIDDDMGFFANDIVKMIESDVDIIAAVCPLKLINWENAKAATMLGEENIKDFAGYFNVNLEPETTFIEVDTPLKVSFIGTGIMLIRKNVFETLKDSCDYYIDDTLGYDKGVPSREKIINFFYTEIEPKSKRLLSEGYAFCNLYKRITSKDVYAAPWTRVNHSGSHSFDAVFINSVSI